MKYNYILDTSSLFYYLPKLQQEQRLSPWCENDCRMIIPEKVKEEIKDMESKIFLKIATPKLSVSSPKKMYIKEVKKKSGESGGLHSLSETDISLIALALQFSREEQGETVVVSEDFAIQNYCSLYGINFKSLRNRKINEKRIIIKQCKACKERYPVKFSSCPSCGSEVFKLLTIKHLKELKKNGSIFGQHEQ
ncbi:MAG: hypothetical protein GWO20_02010 [Candidatus Korarchaeota archaeon]|nr:hypothetical protein [Candidatus Korarchaeota archaeon]NIU84609.1 hypothetical protein [Candidatus Thorarchaeota archaeon]NIW12751.1 hypothetical protein [Candidatus Thorarchaeota archaeon]NIW50959.1 hypothetical protein [Candidatus Korarchaeota archaeon]